MSAPNFDDRRAGPLEALRIWWWLALILVVIGATLGGVAAKAKAPQYTAEERLVVGAENLASYQIPGFAQASQELASNYARYVDNSSVVSRNLRHDLGHRTRTLVSISASPIPSSDVVSVQVVATSRRAAVDGARSVASTLVSLTKSTNVQTSEDLLRGYDSIAGKVQLQLDVVGRLSGRVASAKAPSSSLKGSLLSAQTKLALLKLQESAAARKYTSSVISAPTASQLNVISSASIIGNNAQKTLQIYVVAGAIIGLLVALLLVNVLQRRRERRASRSADRRAVHSTDRDSESVERRRWRRGVPADRTATRRRRDAEEEGADEFPFGSSSSTHGGAAEGEHPPTQGSSDFERAPRPWQFRR